MTDEPLMMNTKAAGSFEMSKNKQPRFSTLTHETSILNISALETSSLAHSLPRYSKSNMAGPVRLLYW